MYFKLHSHLVFHIPLIYCVHHSNTYHLFSNEEIDTIYNIIKIKNYSSDKSKTQTVEIRGNKASLIRIAMEIAKIALYGDFDGCHADLGNCFFDEYDGELTIRLDIP